MDLETLFIVMRDLEFVSLAAHPEVRCIPDLRDNKLKWLKTMKWEGEGENVRAAKCEPIPLIAADEGLPETPADLLMEVKKWLKTEREAILTEGLAQPTSHEMNRLVFSIMRKLALPRS